MQSNSSALMSPVAMFDSFLGHTGLFVDVKKPTDAMHQQAYKYVDVLDLSRT